jgi:hypothetical protein
MGVCRQRVGQLTGKRPDRSPARQACEPRLLTMRDFFSGQEREEVAIGPAPTLGAIDQLTPEASRIRQMQPIEEGRRARCQRRS